MKELSTDIDREQRERDNPEFTAFFWKNLFIAIGIGFFCVIGILVVAVNAEAIDKAIGEFLKMIFI